MKHFAEWVNRNHEMDVPKWMAPLFLSFGGHEHWSRSVEYPWVLLHGRFQPKHRVLDVAGGGARFGSTISEFFKLEMVNLDYDPKSFVKSEWERPVCGDMRRLPFSDACFDRVMCISAVEHVNDPLTSLQEMWRVLKVGGRLLLTIDVSSRLAKNFYVDVERLLPLLQFLDIPWPDASDSKMSQFWDGGMPFYLRSLCLWKDK